MLGVLLCLEGLFALALSFENFEKNCLQATNQLRRRHGVPDLTWSEALAADAQTWANSLAKSDTFEHDYNGMQSRNQGENLAYFKPYKKKCQGIKRDDCVQCREIIDDWYDEVKNYDFGMGRPKAPGSVVMHFTQEVWKNTRQFGIGTARSNRYGFILVARYSPRGNRGGPVIFKDNVFPPGILSDPTPSTNPTAAIITSAPPTPITPRSSATANISVNISVKNVTGSPSLPTSAPTSEGTNSPTSLPSSPTTAPSVAQTGPSGPSKTDSSKCQYFVVNSTTYTYAIIQKCKGKPNVTFIQQATPPPVTTTTRIPETTTQPVTTPTSPPNPCQPNPCKNGGTCKPEEQNFNCSCPNGYSGPLCEERGPSKEERKDALILTNMYRAMHQAPELTWNREMAAKAQDWADKLAREGRLVHENESSTDYGENLAEVGSEEKALLRAIDAWYEEAALYNFQEPKFSTDTGHFSQLVWSATNEVGMAKAKTRDNTNVYVVARYKPAGNVVDQFPSNVKPKQ